MKLLKRLSFLIVVGLLIFSMTLSTVAFSHLYYGELEVSEYVLMDNKISIENNSFGGSVISIDLHDELLGTDYLRSGESEHVYLIRYVLTSAIDDSPFVAYFDLDTGRVSSYDIEGTPMGYRYLSSEEAFWELVEINQEVTRRLREDIELICSSWTDKNSFSIDFESGIFTEYDEYGYATRIYLSEEHFITALGNRNLSIPSSNIGFSRSDIETIEPFFSTGQVRVNVPVGEPRNGPLVGGGPHRTFLFHTHVNFRTFSFPPGMQTINRALVNHWGTVLASGYGMGPNGSRSHSIIGGDSYGMRVSSNQGSFQQVPLQFYAVGAQATLNVSPSSWWASSHGDSTTVHVTSSITWNMPTSNVGWLTISNVSPSNRNGSGSFRINANVNNGAQRTGTITITGGGITRTITVTQEAAATLSVSPTSWNPGANANNTTINVTSNRTWNTPTSNVSWLTISNISPASRNGNGSFRINATANTGAQRTGTITITGGGFTRTVTVTQAAAAATLSVSPTTWNPGANASNTTINVSSNTTWNTPTSNVSWLTISNVFPASRNGNGSFSINATANTGAQRTGTITITGGGFTRTVVVTQAAAAATLSVSPTSWNPGANASNTTINVTSNTTWNTPTSNVSWLTISNISPASRNGNGSFRINATANTGAQRTGTITITGGGFTRTVVVTQVQSSFALSPSGDWESPSQGGTRRITVTTSGNNWNLGIGQGNRALYDTYGILALNHDYGFEATSSLNWISASVTFGPSGATTEIRTQPNYTGVTRYARVMFSEVDGAGDDVFVTQPPEPVNATNIRGYWPIICIGRTGYIDASSDAAPLMRTSRQNVRTPIWYFEHIFDNNFAIRNETTGMFLTARGGNLTREPVMLVHGGRDTRQVWRLISMGGDAYRIQSVYNDALFITSGSHHLNDPFYSSHISLAPLTQNNTTQNQTWRIGYVWASNAQHVTLWRPGPIFIQTREIGWQGNLDINREFGIARDIWGTAIEVTFVDVGLNENIPAYSANIHALGGTRSSICSYIDGREPIPRDWIGFADAINPARHPHVDFLGTINVGAGGRERHVYQFRQSGWEFGFRMGVFVESPARTFTAVHELGHALGFYYHSPNRNDVMYGNFTGRTDFQPSPFEVQHLRQIYRSFR